MTQIDTNKLRALADALGQVPDDTPDAAYFGLDMTHGQARGNLAAILSMAEDNRRLREALEPFADRCAEAVRHDDNDNDGVTVKTKHLRRARQALAAPGGGG